MPGWCKLVPYNDANTIIVIVVDIMVPLLKWLIIQGKNINIKISIKCLVR